MTAQRRLKKIIESARGKYQRDPAREKAIEAAFATATQLQNNQKNAEAQTLYQQILDVEPNHPAVWYHLSLIDLAGKNLDGAEDHALTALECLPNFYPAWVALATVQHRRRELKNALDSISRALVAQPENLEALSLKGQILWEAGVPEAAEACYRAILVIERKKGADSALSWKNLGHTLSLQDKTADAIAAYNKALRLSPDNDELLVALANLYRVNGEKEKAEHALRQALARHPENASALRCLSTVKTFTKDDPDLAVLEKISGSGNSQIHFALGKAYADIGAHDLSFENYAAGNKAVRDTLDFSISRTEEYIDSLTRLFTPELMRRLKDKGHASDKPVFIIGMPRSGTTLAEQILASHPDVFGAGETKYFPRAYIKNTWHGAATGGQEIITKEIIKALTPETLQKIGTDAVAALEKRAPEATRIIDKMPFNFMLVGMIRLALPQAKIIHMQRNPLDTCVSCFTHHFPETPGWKYDLHEMGRFYKAYQKLMAHWHGLFGDKILDVRYETLTANPEAEIRRLLDFCGLGWHDNCLNFHETKRAVRTASTAQVRQPMYSSAVDSWKKYQRHLKPLTDILGTGDTP